MRGQGGRLVARHRRRRRGLTGTGGAAGQVMPPPPGPGPGAIASCKSDTPNQVGPTPLRRISSLEYKNAVRDLFGEMTDLTAASGFPSDEQVGSFVANIVTHAVPDQQRRVHVRCGVGVGGCRGAVRDDVRLRRFGCGLRRRRT